MNFRLLPLSLSAYLLLHTLVAGPLPRGVAQAHTSERAHTGVTRALYTQHRAAQRYCLKAAHCVDWRQDYPQLGPSFANAPSINQQILKFLGAHSPQDLSQNARGWFTEFKNFHKENPHTQAPWRFSGEMQVEHLNPRMVSLRSYAYQYAGGAHGNYTTQFYNLDLQTGKAITLKQILKPDALPALNKMAEEAFRKQREIPADQSLGEAGYHFANDRFQLNDNFLLTPRGLHFLFNVYEVGSYAAGAVELTLYEWQLTDLIQGYDQEGSYYRQLVEQ